MYNESYQHSHKETTVSHKLVLASDCPSHQIENGGAPSRTSRTPSVTTTSPTTALGGYIKRHSPHRRELYLSLGSMHVRVAEICSDELTVEEWGTIQTARDSYGLMWGMRDGNTNDIKEDLFDGLSLQVTPYTTWHYIATVTEHLEEDKTITMRKVYYPVEAYCALQLTDPGNVLQWVEEYLPDDISFWEIVNHDTHTVHSLWEELKTRQAQRLFDFSAISRTGVIPYVLTERDERTREKSGIAFAAIQLLAAAGYTGEYVFAQQCEEFPLKVLRIVDRDGHNAVLDFSPAAQTLALAAQQTLQLNRGHRSVIKHLSAFPGYWTDNTAAASTIRRLVQNGAVSKHDIQTAWQRLRLDALAEQDILRKMHKDMPHGAHITCDSESLIRDDDFEAIITLLTKPRYFKYLLPLQENSALYEGLVYESGDGPYPAALLPEAWERSAYDLLHTAQEKYAI
jgi:hypothetical protein